MIDQGVLAAALYALAGAILTYRLASYVVRSDKAPADWRHW